MSETTMGGKPYNPTPPKYPEPPKKQPVEVKIGDATVEEGGVLKFAVTFDKPAEKPFVIKYETSDITAKAPGDYTGEVGQIKVKKGDTGAEITIQTTEDRKYEPTETMKVTLSENSPWAVIKDGVGIGTITDDDYKKPESYKLNVGDAYAKEGDYLYFKVSLYDYYGKSAKADRDIDFNFTTKDVTTEGSKDYTPTSGPGKIEKGSDHGVIKILAKKDYEKEGYETFKVHVTEDDKHVKVHDGEGHGTIKDVYDYAKPTVKIDDAHGYEGDKLSFKVHAEHNYHGVKVYYRTEAGTANEGGRHTDDYHPTGGYGAHIYLAPGQKEGTIHVQTKEDHKKEDTEYFKVILEDGKYHKGDDYAKGVIYDDDYHYTPPTVAPTDLAPIA